MALSCMRRGAKEAVIFFRIGKGVSSSRRWIALAPSVTYRDALNVTDTHVSALKNKFRVATQFNNGANTATVGVWINAGSRHENEKNNGVTHLLEHLAFKGTTKRSELDIETEAESHGIELSSHSSRELTSIQAKCLIKDVPKAVELLADVVLRNSLSDTEIDRARSAILRELQNIEGDSSAVMMDYLYASAYQGTPLGHSTLGTTSSLMSLNSKELANFIATRYKAPQMVLSAAGGVGHAELLSLAEKYFTDKSLTQEQEISRTRRCRFTGSEVRARYDDLPLAHVGIAIEGPGYGHRDSMALQVAQTVIGSWDQSHYAGKHLSSRLSSACGQEDLCHSFQSFYDKYSDTGLWGLRFVADRHSIEDMMFNVQGEWMRLCNGVTEFEVERAKNQLRMNLMTRLSTPESACSALARQVIYAGSARSLAEIDAEIDAVNASTVRDACTKYIYDKCPAVSSIGPVEGLPDYNRLRAAMYWMRL
jgi:processing peptidase subunit beta